MNKSMIYKRNLCLVFFNFLLVSSLTACSNPLGSTQIQQGPELDEVQPIKKINLDEEGFFEYVDSSGNSTRSFRGKMKLRLHPSYVVVERKGSVFVIPQERVVFIGEKQPDFYGN